MTRLPIMALFVGSIASAQNSRLVDTPATELRFSQPCDVVLPAALLYFQKEAFPLTVMPACTGCFAGNTRKLHDEAGHRLGSNRRVISEYTTYGLQYEKTGPVSQIVHTNLRTDANLHLRSEGGGCRAALHFQYAWYGAELILGFPVEGDRAGAYSNGKLEAAYLAALQAQIDHAAVAKR